MKNTKTYGWGYQDFGASYTIIMSQTNDSLRRQVNWRYWQEDMQRLIQSIKATGSLPIVCTEHPAIENYAYAQMKAVADKMQAGFFDISSVARSFEYNTDPRLWGGSHPGTRTNTQIWPELLNYIEQMPRPRTGLKLFRVRPTYEENNLESLVYDDCIQRAQRFKELTLGHRGLTSEKDHLFDAINQQTPSDRTTYDSEYGMLYKNQPVNFGEYALVEAILPGTGDHVQSVELKINDPEVMIYALNRLTPTRFDDVRYRAFVGVTEAPLAGAKYNDGTTTYTVIGMYQDKLIMSPAIASRNVAGNLKKITGTGPFEIKYTGTENGWHPAYYEDFNKPKGVWEAIPSRKLTAPNVARYMQFDKLSFLLHKPGSFTLNHVEVEFIGYPNKPVYNTSVPQVARGEELLREQFCGTTQQLTGWNVTGSLIPVVPDGGKPPLGTSGVVGIDDKNTMSQEFDLRIKRDDAVEVEVKIWARNWVPLFSPADDFSNSPITEDTFDLAQLDVYIGAPSSKLTACAKFPLWVGLGWQEVRFRYWLVGTSVRNLNEHRITLVGEKGTEIEIAKVSIKEL